MTSLAGWLTRPGSTLDRSRPGGLQDIDRDQKIHMDIASHIGYLPTGIKLVRGAAFFGWMVAFFSARWRRSD